MSEAAPVPSAQRIAAVDVVRGLALFGVIGVFVKQLFWPSDSGKPSDKGDRS